MRAQACCKLMHEPVLSRLGAATEHWQQTHVSPCICCIWLLSLDRCCSAWLQVAVRAWALWSAQ